MQITYQKIQFRYLLEFCIEHCLLAVAFFLPISFNAASVFLGVGGLAWLLRTVMVRDASFQPTWLDALMALLIACSAASVLGSPDRGFSLYNYTHLMGRYVLLYYMVIANVRSLAQVKRLVWVMLASAAGVALYGYYQYFFGVPGMTGEWVDSAQFPGLKLRVFSTLENPNLLAGFLVMMMALTAGMGYQADSWGGRGVMVLLFALLGGCLVLTYSRGAWISLLAVLGVYGVLCNRKVFWLLLLLPVALYFSHAAVWERLTSIINPTDTSSTLRLALWESTWAMIMDKPLFGIGWGSYWLVYPEYDFFIQNAAVKIFHAHNMYLNIAAEIGIPGFLAFIGLLYSHLRIAGQALRRIRERWVGGVLLGVIAALWSIIVNGFTDYILFNIQLSLLYWMLCALLVVIWQAQLSGRYR